jgi:4,5-dihydroxyphthalate decarboxylase
MLKLRGAFSHNLRLDPMLDGTVTPKEIEIEWEQGTAGVLFERHLRDNAFDVFEFSISDYLISREKGRERWDWTAIPIFLSRAFLGLNTWVYTGSGVEGAQDLKGRRFGLADYTMTAGVWFRAMLEELYGIRTSDMQWFNGRVKAHSHGALLGVDTNPPPGVSLTWLDRPEAVSDMLHAGQIDAAFPADGLVFETGGTIHKMFPDGGRAFVESFYQKAGYTPVNHTVAVQRRIVEENPWVPEALFEAFERSKQEAYRRSRTNRAIFSDGQDYDWQESVFGPDPYRSGLAANRAMLRRAAQQSVTDGLTARPANIDDLFWETVRAT